MCVLESGTFMVGPYLEALPLVAGPPACQLRAG